MTPGPVGPGPVIADGLSDGGLMSLGQIVPIYPERAKSRGLEGYVVVEYTVDKLGRAVNAFIIEAKPKGVFDRAVLDAVHRAKYRPLYKNGEPQVVHGVRSRLVFELET